MSYALSLLVKNVRAQMRGATMPAQDLTLTDEDRAAIEQALRQAIPGIDIQRIPKGWETVYRAGVVAGRARAIEEAAQLRKTWGRAHTYASENADHYRGFDAGLDAYVAAIRKLNAPAASATATQPKE